jgi:hypothetical protein
MFPGLKFFIPGFLLIKILAINYFFKLRTEVVQSQFFFMTHSQPPLRVSQNFFLLAKPKLSKPKPDIPKLGLGNEEGFEADSCRGGGMGRSFLSYLN